MRIILGGGTDGYRRTGTIFLGQGDRGGGQCRSDRKWIPVTFKYGLRALGCRVLTNLNYGRVIKYLCTAAAVGIKTQ